MAKQSNAQANLDDKPRINHSNPLARTLLEKLDYDQLERRLADSQSHTAQVLTRYTGLIGQRINRPAFHPNANQQIIQRIGEEALFIVLRTAPNGQEQVLAVNNVSGSPQALRGTAKDFGLSPQHDLTDVLSGRTFGWDESGQLNLSIEPYQVLWLLSA